MKKMSEIKEAGLLRELGPLLSRHTKGFPLGTGDDVAITPGTQDQLVWTIDTMVEGTHFQWYKHPLCTGEAIGIKLAESNLSDLASKGATPLLALVSLGVPPDADVERIKGIYTGIDQSLTQHKARLVGGDTVRSPVWTLTMTLVGTLPNGVLIASRSAAKPGMSVYTTGWTGESAAGLHLLQQPDKARALPSSMAHHLIMRHLQPTGRIDMGRTLVRAGLGQIAMIDLSDGIGKDAGEIARNSGVRLVLEKIPISQNLHDVAWELSKNAVKMAVFGGEDYELLFCTDAPQEQVMALSSRDLPIHRIGKVVEGRGVILRHEKGHDESLDSSSAFDHFDVV